MSIEPQSTSSSPIIVLEHSSQRWYLRASVGTWLRTPSTTFASRTSPQGHSETPMSQSVGPNQTQTVRSNAGAGRSLLDICSASSRSKKCNGRAPTDLWGAPSSRVAVHEDVLALQVAAHIGDDIAIQVITLQIFGRVS